MQSKHEIAANTQFDIKVKWPELVCVRVFKRRRYAF